MELLESQIRLEILCVVRHFSDISHTVCMDGAAYEMIGGVGSFPHQLSVFGPVRSLDDDSQR